MTDVSAVDRQQRFEALVQSVYAPLQRYLRRRTDPASADDVLGDVLLVMWRRVDEIPAEAMAAWCYGVARGCLANSARGAQRRQQLLHRLEEEAGRTSSAGAPFSGDRDLQAALAALPEQDQELLRLWAWEQLAPRDIAVALGITPNAASIRLHRALRRLRKMLGAGKNTRLDGHLVQHQDTEAPQ